MSGKGSELKLRRDLQCEALKNVRQGGEREKKRRGKTGTKGGPLAHAEYSDKRNHGSPRSKARSDIFTGHEVDFSVSSTLIDDVRSMPTQHVQINEALFSRTILFGAPPVYCAQSPGWLAGSACLPASKQRHARR